jgi:hypothetical protein
MKERNQEQPAAREEKKFGIHTDENHPELDNNKVNSSRSRRTFSKQPEENRKYKFAQARTVKHNNNWSGWERRRSEKSRT